MLKRSKALLRLKGCKKPYRKRYAALDIGEELMLEIELFEKIKSGEITSTKEFRVMQIRRGTDDWKKDKTFWAILHLLEAGYITGDRIKGDENGNYESLQVTSSGLEVYKFMKTPISDFGKPTFLEICKNGIISAFAGKIIWWLVATVIIVAIPSFNEKAQAIVTSIYQNLFG